MGCGGSVDLSEEFEEIERWKNYMASQSIWMGRANMRDDVLDYLEIQVVSKKGEELIGKRVTNIAESKYEKSTRFEFEVEKNTNRKKGDPSHVVIFYWEDPSGLTLRGTMLNESSKKIHGDATYIDPKSGQSYSGEFKIACISSNSMEISPRASRTDSRITLFETSQQMAMRKYSKEEHMRLSKVEDKALKFASTSSDLGDTLTPKRDPGRSASRTSRSRQGKVY